MQIKEKRIELIQQKMFSSGGINGAVNGDPKI
jgi:hypothetical protein